MDRSVPRAKSLILRSGRKSIRLATGMIAVSLLKLAKHLALLACLLIVGRATGQTMMGPVAPFFLILSAAIIHAYGRRLQTRSASPTGMLRDDQ